MINTEVNRLLRKFPELQQSRAVSPHLPVAIVAIVGKYVAVVGTDVAVVGTDVAVVGTDVAVVGTDVAVVGTDVAVVGTDVAVVGTDVAVVGTDVAVVGTDVAVVGTDVAVVGTDVAVVGTDVAVVGTDVAVVGTDVAVVGTDVAVVGTNVAVVGTNVAAVATDVAVATGILPLLSPSCIVGYSDELSISVVVIVNVGMAVCLPFSLVTDRCDELLSLQRGIAANVIAAAIRAMVAAPRTTIRHFRILTSISPKKCFCIDYIGQKVDDRVEK